MIIEIDGPHKSIDNCGERYKTYAISGDVSDMEKIIGGLVEACKTVKPEGAKADLRPVVIVWRMKPKPVVVDGIKSTVSRFSIYPEFEYKRLLRNLTVFGVIDSLEVVGE